VDLALLVTLAMDTVLTDVSISMNVHKQFVTLSSRAPISQEIILVELVQVDILELHKLDAEMSMNVLLEPTVTLSSHAPTIQETTLAVIAHPAILELDTLLAMISMNVQQEFVIH